MQIDIISRHLSAAKALIDDEAELSARSVTGRTSQFWSELFDQRPNFPDLTAFLAFRRDNFGYGMADERQGGLERERAYFDRVAEIFRFTVPPDHVKQVDEPCLGAPYAFDREGITRSAAFWVNAATAHRVKDFVSAYGARNRPLNILEIGAGWGGAAYQLHHLIDVASYTIVDLPENLLLSTAYLASTLALPLTFLRRADDQIYASLPRTITGLLPHALPLLNTKYDLILNSFSLQEMDRETVEAYLTWIENALSEDGVFISFNAHGKAGIRRPFDYHYERFNVKHMGMFRKYPSGFLNTIPSEVVLGRKTPPNEEEAVSSSSPKLGHAIDAIGCLHQFGLDCEIKPLVDAALSGHDHDEAFAALLALREFFTLDNQARDRALEAPSLTHIPAIKAYLKAQHLLFIGKMNEAKPELEAALSHGLQGFARMRAEVMFAILSGKKDIPQHQDAPNARIVYPEVGRMLDEGDLSPIVHQFARIVDLG